MSERIARIEVFPVRIKLVKPFIISLGRVDYAENLFVRITTDSGISGHGECCPFRTINGESLETAVIVAGYLKDAITGMDPADLDGCIHKMDEAIYGNHSVKSAFDIALYDINSRIAGKPLFEYLGGHKRALATDYTVSLDTPHVMVAQALQIVGEGYHAVKVKVGRRKEEDLERIRAIRQAVDPSIPLRLDANQGWNVEDAIAILSQLGGMNIEFCEEPIKRWDFMNLARVRSQSAVPVMADESCGDHHDLERLIGLGACDYVNIKLGKSGGIHEAMKMIRIAEKHRIPVQVGGFVESRLGFTASAHLALASDVVRWCDFDTPLMLSEDPVEGGIMYGPGGSVEVPDGIGLSASLTDHQ
jgi:L-alanine-DL-glutamate epimerase-like enolase superfamily enzyme